MNIKLLTEHHLEVLSLKGGCTGLYETTFVKMPHCWKLHVTAQMLISATHEKDDSSSRRTSKAQTADQINQRNLRRQY